MYYYVWLYPDWWMNYICVNSTNVCLTVVIVIEGYNLRLLFYNVTIIQSYEK